MDPVAFTKKRDLCLEAIEMVVSPYMDKSPSPAKMERSWLEKPLDGNGDTGSVLRISLASSEALGS